MSASSTPPARDPLRAFLWGKRQAHRHALALDVLVRGTLKPISAMSLDLSASGVLLRVPTRDLEPQAASDGDVDPFLLAQTHFRGPCRVQFKKPRIKTHVEMVRLDFRADDPGFLYLGCRFTRPLDGKQLKRLGLEPDHCGPEVHGLPSEMLPLRAADDPVVCRVFASATTEEPLFEAFLIGAGRKSLCMRLDEADVAVLAGKLRGEKLRVEVLEGDDVDWTTGAKLQAIGFLDDVDGALELGLLVNKRPSRALRRKFRPPTAA